MNSKVALAASLLAVCLTRVGMPAHAAEPIKLAVIKSSAFGPIFIAQDRGYFAKQGLEAEFVFFEAPQGMGPAVLSGDVDIATGNANGAFLNLAAQGALRVIAAGSEEMPGFHDFVVVASNVAYSNGLKTVSGIGGHSTASGTVAGPQSYSLALIEEKYRIDPASVRLVQVGSIPNIVSAVVGGQTDFALNPTTAFATALSQDKVKLLSYVGDEVRWQLGVVYTSAKLANDKPDMINRFLGAYREAVKEYHDAFAAPDGTRRDGQQAGAVLATMAKYVGQSADAIAPTVGYFDAQARLDEEDFLNQVRWYRTQGLVKPDTDGEKMIDKRYAQRLPER
jgi:NitT/TauT family transport system substrate-binding protein